MKNIKTLIRLQLTFSAVLIVSFVNVLLNLGYCLFDNASFNWYSLGCFIASVVLLGVVVFKFKR